MSQTPRECRVTMSPLSGTVWRCGGGSMFPAGESTGIEPVRRNPARGRSNLFRSEGPFGPIVRAALVFAIALGFSAAFHERPAWGQNPDFSNVTDILGGQDSLLRYDDLLVTADISPAYNTYMLETSGGQITSQSGFTEVTNSCGATYPYGSPHRAKAGRVFALPNDVIVSVAPSSSAVGPRDRYHGGKDKQ
jgi:hypothetical protein